MNNRFTNFIDFVSTDATTQAKNLYHPTGSLRPYHAQISDFWRLLIKNSILQGAKIEDIEARIVEVITTCAGVWDGETFTDTTKRARLRKQYCETYTEFVLKVNAPSTVAAYKQFAIKRANGQSVLGTVRTTSTTTEEYAKAIKAHFEAYPYATVIVHRNGTLLKVRVYNNRQFVLNDEAVTIEVGNVVDKNTNRPTLAASFVETIAYAARFSYRVAIENVEPGNIFFLNGVTYEAASGDDESTVLAALLGTASRLIVLQTDTVSASATAGVRYLINTNSPSLNLAYFDVDGGNDRYIVTVGASLAAGNTFQIAASGETTKTYTATSSSTASDVVDALTEVSGYYEVPTGTAPSWQVVAGTQAISNVNTPSISLEDQQVIAAVNTDKYRVIVGNDVEKGNLYTLGELTYTATSADTANTVGVALGLEGSIGYLEVEEDATLAAFASKGFRYTSEDVADVTILQQPRVRKSGQWVLEVDFSGLTNDKVYSVQLFNKKTDSVLGYSNFLHVATSLRNTVLLEVADQSEAHGYQYYESGLTQRIRLPLHLKTPMQRTAENRNKRIDGGYNRTSTQVEDTQMLVTQGESSAFHKCLALWLKHSKVWIENQSYYCEGEYSEMLISEWPERKQAMANLVLNQEHNNKNYYFTTSSKPLSYGEVILHGYAYGLRIILKTNTFEYDIREGSNYLPSADYEIIIYNDGDERKVRIAPEGYETIKILIPKQSFAKERRLVRVESDTTLEILCERTTALAIDYLPQFEGETLTIEGYTCEKVIMETADFSEDFSDDFNNGE